MAPKYSFGKYMFVLIPECPYRKALAGNARFERLTARPKLLKFVKHLIDETIQKESEEGSYRSTAEEKSSGGSRKYIKPDAHSGSVGYGGHYTH
jgi:hypothetical protein